MYRPRAGTGPPVPLNPSAPNSPGPVRSPTEISLAQLVHVDSNRGYLGDGEEEDIGEGTSRQAATGGDQYQQGPVNTMDQRDVMPFSARQQPQHQFPQQHEQHQPQIPGGPQQEETEGLGLYHHDNGEEDQPPPEYTSPEGSLRRRGSDERIDNGGYEERQEAEADEDADDDDDEDDDDDDESDNGGRRRLLPRAHHHEESPGYDDEQAPSPPVPSYEAATAGEHHSVSGRSSDRSRGSE